MFTSRPISLLASNRTSVFFMLFMDCAVPFQRFPSHPHSVVLGIQHLTAHLEISHFLTAVSEHY